MKKILVFLMVFTLMFSLAACGGDDTSEDETSEEISDISEAESKDDSEEEDESKEDEKSDEESDEESETDISEESEDETPLPEFLNQYVSFGDEKINVNVRATDATSIRLTKINEAPEAGDIVLFTSDFGSTIASGDETYEDFAVLVCTYDHEIFTYKRTSYKKVDADEDKAKTSIPQDGFVVAVSKAQSDQVSKLNNIKDSSIFFVHGVQIGDVSFDLKKARKAPKIDGSISASEYGTKIWDVNENNKLWDYSQFEKDNYYATAEVYATYDDDNFYIGIIVDSPEHFNNVKQASASGMYQYECIQVNLASVDPLGEYMAENFDNIINTKARDEGKIRQYGFAVNDDGETIYVVWMGAADTLDFTGETVCDRDDVNQKTYYEVAIPWAELGTVDEPFAPKSGAKIGFSVSINSTTEDDVTKGIWKNIMMRDGGGIIGRNDFTKMSSVTLK